MDELEYRNYSLSQAIILFRRINRFYLNRIIMWIFELYCVKYPHKHFVKEFQWTV